jgi:glycosyltransferase involved in cell wall biosynthesis
MSLRVLFVHRAFPAQFGRLAAELTRRYGWRCHFFVEHLSHCPPPSAEMLAALDVRQWPRPAGHTRDVDTPWPQVHGQALACARAVFEAVRARPDLRPDLVVGHGGLVPTLLLREVLDCPLVDYCEYYFAPRRQDLTYRLDLPPVEPAPFFPRCINAATLLNLSACDAGYTPTEWQRRSFPERFRGKIEVHPDGVDAELYRPRRPAPSLAVHGIPDDARVVTFVARGLESVRGFDLFMALARRIAAARPDVHFVVVGGDATHYGWDALFTDGRSFKDWVLGRYEGDRSRCHFLGMIDPPALADVLARSDLHVFLSVPFVPSWSLLNALSAGCVVLAGDVEPVREIIEPGRNGLLAPLFDQEELTRAALRVLDDPAGHAPLGAAGRRLVEEKYSLEVAVPALRDFFERVRRERCSLPTGAP